MHLLEELHRIGTTIVVATHNQPLVSRFAHPRLHLADGELLSFPAASPTTQPAPSLTSGATD